MTNYDLFLTTQWGKSHLGLQSGKLLCSAIFRCYYDVGKSKRKRKKYLLFLTYL